MKIQINKAIYHYNLNVKKEGQKDLTIEALAEKVITSKRSLSSSKVKALQQWQSGNMYVKACTVEHLERISKITGYPICKLISK